MKARLLMWGTAMFAMAVLGSAGSARAQYQAPPTPPPQPEQGAEGGEAKPANPPKIDKKEEAAYKVLFEARTAPPATQIPLGEDFLKKFPQSHYLPGVYSQLTSAYYATGQEDKMFVAGNKAIELNPDNIDVLALMAMAMPRRIKPNSVDGAQQLQKAEAYAKRAIELIPNLAKPEEMDDAAFQKAKDDKLSMAHSGLGLLDYEHQKFDDAITELSLAVKLSASPDPVDYYLLGNADVQTSHFADAVDAYDKCSASGPLVMQCKAREEDAKKKEATELSAPPK